jgi:endogenous inhibitor of DNA gyrase (YacG/DUF329 family)
MENSPKIIKNCLVCNDKFETKSGRALYCSKKCQYKNKYKKKSENSPLKICEYCSIEYKSKHINQKFCGKDCQTKASKKIKSQPCANCNKDVTRTKSKNRDGTESKNVFCDRKCYLEHHSKGLKKDGSKIEYLTKKCDICGKDVTRESHKFKYKKIYCSDECRSNRDKVLICAVCKTLFCAFQYRKSNNKKGFTIVRPFRKVCSQKCHHEFYRTDESRKEKISKAFSGTNHPNYVNGASYNGRIRKTDIKENFGARDKKEVFKKFNNKCFNCNGTDNLTIDHNVPFSRGGRLTLSNTVLLCRSCNSSKNAKLPTDFYSDKKIKELKKLGVDSNSLFNY